jgi:hypothetical protein
VKRRWIEAIVVGLALTGCAGIERAPTIVPYKTDYWSVDDQGSFVETCDASVSDVYCVCALGDMMTAYPDPRRLPNPIPPQECLPPNDPGTSVTADQRAQPTGTTGGLCCRARAAGRNCARSLHRG